MYKSISITVLVGCMLLSLTSCVGDDLSNCPTVERLRIRFINGLSENANPIQHYDVSQLADVFIFDSQGMFYRRLSDINTVMTADYVMETTLPAGTYSFVSWLNLQSCYEIEPAEFQVNQTHINDALLHLSLDASNMVNTAPHLLFHGIQKEIEITGDYQDIEIPVVPDNYQVNFKVTGPLWVGINYQFNVQASNGIYKFDNSFAPCQEFDYRYTVSPDENNVLYASLRFMRLFRDRNPMLTITNRYTGDCIYKHNLVDLILLLEKKLGVKIDFSRDYVFDIELDLRGDEETADMEAFITINGWRVWDEENV
ncbi:FimB/Mfa2 family fimbrial subunit [Bacteroides sp. 224]|uniref:FimB/Mfa2 family fimbrial subunit n=1 Tax=Bacteroides sp. 224 TaxID=2302936 RepID=UPI0013D6F124|nr:FimB/Mfa2 family fimbrial subunit [Bacteroides sp. 224]NDV66109.1 hypothetical protein [Bacteroides sp. 224]